MSQPRPDGQFLCDFVRQQSKTQKPSLILDESAVRDNSLFDCMKNTLDIPLAEKKYDRSSGDVGSKVQQLNKLANEAGIDSRIDPENIKPQ